MLYQVWLDQRYIVPRGHYAWMYPLQFIRQFPPHFLLRLCAFFTEHKG
jgi:hypothetical protein